MLVLSSKLEGPNLDKVNTTVTVDREKYDEAISFAKHFTMHHEGLEIKPLLDTSQFVIIASHLSPIVSALLCRLFENNLIANYVTETDCIRIISSVKLREKYDYFVEII